MVLTLLVALLAPHAEAASIEAWSRSDFGSDTYLSGVDGWINGYGDDLWYADEGWALSATDDDIDDSNGDHYGSGWAGDNWLIRGDNVGDGGIVVSLVNEDDDTIGVVSHHNGSNSFYMAFHSADSAPPPLGYVQGPHLFLFKIDNGNANELGRVQRQMKRDDLHELRLEQNDGLVRVTLNGKVEIEVTDSSPLSPGRAGIYAYNSGYEGDWHSSNALFDDVEVYWFDEDNDGVSDDVDNCEFDANPSQGPCDGSDTDTDVTDTDDTDVDVSPEGKPTLVKEDLGISFGDCGCNTGSSSGWIWLLLPLPLVIRRR
ncbi:MAG: hypothetical protein HN348_11930 [Proteobacteria bacterium]|nr:hypothetical protein [Pseudomonadota bacterium]